MTACILIVDDVLTNIKVLEAKLEHGYYTILSALNGKDAIKIAQKEQPDIILLDVMMPEMDGFEVCERLKAEYSTKHIPIIFITALDDIESKIKGLNYGVEDFLSKPINDVALFARVKSIVRLKMFSDELRIRNIINDEINHSINLFTTQEDINNLTDAKIIIIDDDKVQSEQVRTYLTKEFHQIYTYNDNFQQCITDLKSDQTIDLIIINMQSSEYHGLRLCSQVRSNHNMKHIPILMLIDEESTNCIEKGMEIGVNDYLTIPVHQQELMARARLQLKKKAYQDALYNHLINNMEMAITDPLTKCYNRFYFDKYLKNKIIHKNNNHILALIMLDVDFFKKVNDIFGHLIGDKTLQQVAHLISVNIRLSDFLARFGGEEFVILLPDLSSVTDVVNCARRILETIEKHDFIIKETSHNFTASIGIAIFNNHDDSYSLIERADQNLYQAKSTGRNKIIIDDKYQDSIESTKTTFEKKQDFH